MSSVFKSRGSSGKKTKSGDKATKEKSKKKSEEYNPEDFKEDTEELPQFRDRRSFKSLSISKSGRHKMNRKQRGSVLSDDMYSPEPQPNSPDMKMPSSPWGDNSQCKDTLNGSLGRSHLGPSQPRASQPTAV